MSDPAAPNATHSPLLRRPAGRWRRALFGAGIACVVVVLAGATPAGAIPGAEGDDDGAVVRIIARTHPSIAQPGELVRAVIEMQIMDGWHVNSDRPLEEFLIPTEVFLDEGSPVSMGRFIFPEPHMSQLAFSDTEMSLFEGTAYIGLEFQVPPDASGTVSVPGALGYQACDDERCLAPEEIAFTLEVSIADAGGGADARDGNMHPAFEQVDWTPAGGAAVETSGSGVFDSDRSLALIFLATFFGGLALNLTPCVYPMIPITISVFGSQGGGPRRSLVLAIFYVLGMAITYSALGTFAATTGNLLGSALQNPIVLVFVAVVMLVLALSMFGMYDITMPQGLSRMAGETRQGVLGSLFMGLTVGIIAAPCIGPFVLGLLTFVGTQGSAFLGFSLFFVLAIGLGLPFLVLAVVSGSVSSLPRSGGWMVWVKKLFGFILIGMAFYFLTRSKQLIDEQFLFPILAVLSAVAGVYLGFIDRTRSPGGGFVRVKRVVGALGIAGAVALLVGPALMPERPGIVWTAYDEALLAEARAAGKPVIVDFSAAWCIPCKELDHFTFAAAPVVSKSASFVTLKADLTQSGSPEVKALTEKFGIKGVPTIIFLAPDGTEMNELRCTSVIEPDEFLSRMQEALGHDAESGVARS